MPIDEVRILTNIFTGNTGLGLARSFARKKHQVTLLINPHCGQKIPAAVKVREFRYFKELQSLLEEELKSRHYDLIIHCAAVSDYHLKKPAKGKLPSQEKELVLKLQPTPKLIKKIRSLARNSFLVQFKLEAEGERLLNRALSSMIRNRADLAVANAYSDLKQGYLAYIIDRSGHIKEIHSKTELFKNILRSSTQPRK